MDSYTSDNATGPMDRINIHFKGLLPTDTCNPYLIAAEYSRYPFAFPYSNIHTSTVINWVVTLFSMRGMPDYIHLNKGHSLLF